MSNAQFCVLSPDNFIIIAALINTGVKAQLAALIEGRRLAQWCVAILVITIGASLLTALLTDW